MSDLLSHEANIDDLIDAFEASANVTEEGHEYWFARDLQKLFGYGEWRNFTSTLDRAKIACGQSGNSVDDHFVDVNKMIELAKGAEREIEDLMLSRYACYLTAQNADSKKKPVAFAQTYFAIQTRKQEITEQNKSTAVPISEDEQRVYLRNQIKEHNKKLSSAAKDAGIVTPQEFAIFHSKGYQGLYKKNVKEIRTHKGLAKSADILDRMGSTELAANFFRVTQTEEKLRKENIKGKIRAYNIHYAVGRQVREAMLSISGIAPENLLPADSIKKAEKRLKNRVFISKPTNSSSVGDAVKEAVIKSDKVVVTSNVPEIEDRVVDLSKDIWKYSLLIMATKEDGEILTSSLIDELQNYIKVPDEAKNQLKGRNDSRFSQLVRNLKSHKTSKTNFIYQGYAESIRGGFKITQKGREFVLREFS
jgi:hypothetical protein